MQQLTIGLRTEVDAHRTHRVQRSRVKLTNVEFVVTIQNDQLVITGWFEQEIDHKKLSSGLQLTVPVDPETEVHISDAARSAIAHAASRYYPMEPLLASLVVR